MNFTCKDQHEAEAILITCIDFRFHQATLKYVSENITKAFDLLTIPGVQKNFVENTVLGKEAIKVIKDVSLPLHKIKKIVLMGHWDCGGYGGSKSFITAENEENKYIEDLKKAKEILAQEFSNLEILIGYSKVEKENLNFVLLD